MSGKRIFKDLQSGNIRNESCALDVKDFVNLYQSFLSHKKSEGLREISVKEYKKHLVRFSNYLTEHQKTEIGSEEISEFIRYLTYDREKWSGHPYLEGKGDNKRGLKPSSVNVIIRTLRTFFKWCVAHGHVSMSPTTLFKEQTSDSNFIIPTDEQIISILSVLDKSSYCEFRDYCMILLFIDAGIRVGEAIGLTVNEIDFITGSINIRAQTSKSKRDRIVYISPVTSKELQKLIKNMGIVNNDHVFQSQYGQPYKNTNFNRNFKAYAKRAGVDGFRVSPHTLRHYAATRMLASGMDIFQVQRILGHRDIKHTAIYINYVDNDIKAAHAEASPVYNVVKSAKPKGKIKFK